MDCCRTNAWINADIMAFKRNGEVEVEELYKSAPKGVTYTIVRPGGLTDGPVVGPKGVCLRMCEVLKRLVRLDTASGPDSIKALFSSYWKFELLLYGSFHDRGHVCRPLCCRSVVVGEEDYPPHPETQRHFFISI